MAILEEEVKVYIDSKNIDFYKSKNYEINITNQLKKEIIPKGTKIFVKPEDLQDGSNVRVTKICDNCGALTPNLQYCLLFRSRQVNENLDLCRSCTATNTHKRKKKNLPFEKSIWSTYPQVAKLLKFPERGYQLSQGSHSREDFICPDCSFEIKGKLIPNIINYGLSCPRCSDGNSYPEKFMASLLNQLKVDFETQKIFNWLKKRRYDFYIPTQNYIIETHGNQHFGKGFRDLGGKLLEEEQENDKLKSEFAMANGIEKYIVVDCARSEFLYIKNSIKNSELSEIYDLSIVDWLKCHEYACSTLVKVACDLWNNGNDVKQICKIMKIKSGTTVRKYLKNGTELGWSDYDSRKVMRSVGKMQTKNKRRPVVRLSLDGEYVDEFKSKTYASKCLSIYLFGISEVCAGKRESVKDYKFMYKEDYEKQINTK